MSNYTSSQRPRGRQGLPRHRVSELPGADVGSGEAVLARAHGRRLQRPLPARQQGGRRHQDGKGLRATKEGRRRRNFVY